ncbi:HpcH/HpaI aldolase/citrate lyase family protein [Roseateles amylovorans]|uniref:Aldolase/citrate lyase family protein n=1 Tax=Roseateles amylovorans TaxID=2978473 RepID=A0ABY6B9D6_9BURK|nr:aldolase/citrate lyase family protein [Roseateles amylovorans]UXH80195.1 aldolase/citrate lyase family protein [Roseateles amylovorans]
MSLAIHPAQALFEEGVAPVVLPVVDHYCGVEARMRKSLELQVQMGPVFDITLDCEDGAPIGGEAEHMLLVLHLLNSTLNAHGRVGVRVHPFQHPSFEADVEAVIAGGGEKLAYLMIPKPEGLDDLQRAINVIDDCLARHHIHRPLPLHTLIETHGALRDVMAIAAHPRIESLSFGLMDFVSAHRGAIPRSALTVEGQFSHPLVQRAKLAIAAAAHTYGKTPSHCVVTEFKSERAIQSAAERAGREFGYTRMWSIHPHQIQPIIDAFAPSVAEIDEAIELLLAAQAAQWAPIQYRDVLHDRASYRLFWHLLQRAHRTGQNLPAEVTQAWFRAPPVTTPASTGTSPTV